MSAGLPKCFSHLQSKGFISLNSKAIRIKELDTFGIIVKANLKRCLNDYYRLIDKFTVFPVLRVESISNLNDHLLCGKKLDKYAVSFDSSDLVQPISEPNNELSLWSSKSSLKNLIIFCDPNQSLNLFYSFQNERYRWWRKLSGCPSHFHQSQIGKCSITKEENVSIDFKSPLVDDKTLCLETIKYITDPDQIKNSIGVESSSHIIWCKTFPDNATISYLIDGCTTDDTGRFKEIWFHECLTPYHVAITIKPSQDSNLNAKLDAIADFLIKELKEFGITVFPFKHQSNNLDDKSFQWFDQIGIPYSISITEGSLRLGVIGLRNKDTKLEEEVHVTRVKINLLLYLKLMKPLDIKLAIMESNKAS